MTVRQAKKLVGKVITVRSLWFEKFSIVLDEQEKPRSQSFWYHRATDSPLQRGLMNVTTLTLIE